MRLEEVEGLNTAVKPATSSLQDVREAALSTTYISLGSRRTASVHEFYRYPARFSPELAEAVISAFSRPGDLVVDPFMGGGTVPVEAQLLGRRCVGNDLNSLAHFVAQAKSVLIHKAAEARLREWGSTLYRRLRLSKRVSISDEAIRGGYLRHLNGSSTWRIRNLIWMALETLEDFPPDSAEERLGRCAILRTGQWALDMRRDIPGSEEFRETLTSNALGMIDASLDYTGRAIESARRNSIPISPTLTQEALPGLAMNEAIAEAPSLVFTSPPYPGVYVLYHRWKVLGRLESPAPYWITGGLDGHGQAHYTMAARADQARERYFEELALAFDDVSRFSSNATWLVQVVGFNDIARQFDRYLEVMADVGFDEVRFETLATEPDGRLWRPVPSRRWWVTTPSFQGVAPNTAREVVLFFRKT